MPAGFCAAARGPTPTPTVSAVRTKMAKRNLIWALRCRNSMSRAGKDGGEEPRSTLEKSTEVRRYDEVPVMAGLRRVILILVFAAGCGGSDTPPPAGSGSPGPSPGPSVAPLRVLVLTATAGFRHGSIETARQTLSSLAARTGEVNATATEDLSQIRAARVQTVNVR